MQQYKISTIYCLFGLFILTMSCSGKIKETQSIPNAKGELVTDLDWKIWNVYQDQKDNYWFGSNGNGIFRYDGEKLIRYTRKDGLINNTIRSIQEDHLGNIFIGTSHGISKYDGKIFTTLTPIIAAANEWKLTPNDLWFNCNGNALYRYDGVQLFALNLPGQDLKTTFGIDVQGIPFENMNDSPYAVYGLDKDKVGNLWIGTVSAGAFRYDGTSFLWIGEKELSTLPDGRVPGVRSMLEDKDGYLWLSNFISKYKINDDSSTATYEKLVGIDPFNELFQDRLPYFNSGLVANNGDLWMTTYTGGVWKYEDNQLRNFPVYRGVTEALIISIYQDNQGVLWLGTNNLGIFKFNGEQFEHFEPMIKAADGQSKLKKTQGSQSSDNVRCSLQDQAGNLWFGTTGEGLYKYDGQSFTQFTATKKLDNNTPRKSIDVLLDNNQLTTTNALKSNMVYCLLEDKAANIWIGTAAGVVRYDGKTFREIPIDLPKNRPPNKNTNTHDVFNIMQDKSGKIWFATIDGVFTYDGKSFTPFIIKEEGDGYKSTNHNVENILEDKAGNIWFGGRTNEGVFRYDGKTITNLKLNPLKGHDWAWPMLEDQKGNIWFSNWGGVYRYDGKIFTPFTKNDGFCNEVVTRIMEDQNGNIWFGGKGGICRYNGIAFTSFSTEDGLTNDSVWSILEDRTGDFWVGTRNTSLYRFNGESFTSFSE